MRLTVDYSTLGDEIKKAINYNSRVRAVLMCVKEDLEYIEYVKRNKELDPVLDGCLHNLNMKYEDELLPLKEVVKGRKYENLYYKILLEVENILTIH